MDFLLLKIIAVEIHSIFDEALRELDEFNKRSQAEEVEEENEVPVIME